MKSKYAKVKELWGRQQIKSPDVNYTLWQSQKESLQRFSDLSRSCIFTVDVYNCNYSFASGSFTDILGFKSSWIKDIEKQGNIIEERIHPDDREQLLDIQIRNSEFIYSLPSEERNDYRNVYQFRMLNGRKYINVVSRQQVMLKDRNNKAWIIMGMMDVLPDQSPIEEVKCSVVNLKTGVVSQAFQHTSAVSKHLTEREKEILRFISQGYLSKEIAGKLDISIHTIHNHRKNILSKLGVDNAIEAINIAKSIMNL